jgi:hypothetical protein
MGRPPRRRIAAPHPGGMPPPKNCAPVPSHCRSSIDPENPKAHRVCSDLRFLLCVCKSEAMPGLLPAGRGGPTPQGPPTIQFTIDGRVLASVAAAAA